MTKHNGGIWHLADVVLDHIIVGKDGHASLKALMLILGWLGRADYTSRSIDVN
jgi:hypothetical protein